MIGGIWRLKAMSYSKQSVSESFLMSNMSPQLPLFNRGVWKRLEKQVRDWIAISDSLYVVTGPVLISSLPTIGENKVSIPKAYYKAILRFCKGDINGIGFLLKHEKSSKKIADFATSIDTIEKITGLNFFYLLSMTFILIGFISIFFILPRYKISIISSQILFSLFFFEYLIKNFKKRRSNNE